MSRWLPLVMFLGCLLFASHGAEPPVAWPLWDGQESTAEYAKRAGLEPTKILDLGNGEKLELVLIPAGQFIMGTPEPEKPIFGQIMLAFSGFVLFVLILLIFIRAWKKHTRPQYSLGYLMLMTFVASFVVWGGVRWYVALLHINNRADERPAHVVTLTRPFYMGKFTVTQEQYQQVMGTNPSNFKGNNLPAEQVSWNDAQEFCKKANASSAQAMRLPTEAEWEYACRAGTSTEYYSGNIEEDLKRVAWYRDNSDLTPHSVGQKDSNKFGLYDMHGNVCQWCQDWFGEYKDDAVADPQGSAQGLCRMLRGSSWDDFYWHCRSNERNRGNPVVHRDIIGFRVVVPVVKTP